MSFCHKFQSLWWLCLIFSRYLLSYWRCFSRYMLYNRGFSFSRSLLSRMYLLFLSRFASAECQALRPLVPGKASPCARTSPHAGTGNKRKTTQLIITVSLFCFSLSHRRSFYTDGNPPHCISRQKTSPAEDFKMVYWDLQCAVTSLRTLLPKSLISSKTAADNTWRADMKEDGQLWVTYFQSTVAEAREMRRWVTPCACAGGWTGVQKKREENCVRGDHVP